MRRAARRSHDTHFLMKERETGGVPAFPSSEPKSSAKPAPMTAKVMRAPLPASGLDR